MHAALLAEDLDAADLAGHEASGVAGHGARRHGRERLEGHRDRALEAVGEGPEPRAQDQRETRRRGAGVLERPGQLRRERPAAQGRLAAGVDDRPVVHRNIPAMVAVIQEAMAPPSMARSASRLRSRRRPSARELMPPIWMPTDAKLAKPHRA